MDLRHKHWAVVAVGVLLAALIGIIAWYFLVPPKALAPEETNLPATTTPAVIQADKPQHLVENATYYDIDLQYPSATPLASVSASANVAAVAQMRKFAEDTAKQFKTNGNFENLSHDDIQMIGLDQRKEALTSEYDVYTGTRTVSYVFAVYEDTLGAHPNTYFRTFTYNTKTGSEVTLNNLFLPSVPYLEKVSVRARADLPGIINRMSGGYAVNTDMMIDGTRPVAENFQTFYLKGSNLVLLFPPYQVGPYALGTVIDSIPLSDFKTSLKAEYAQ